MATPITDPANPRVTFSGTKITCLVLPYQMNAPELQVWRTQFAATVGTSEIIGGAGGRVIELPLVLRSTKFDTRVKLETYIDTELNSKLTGINGTLIIEPGHSLREPVEGVAQPELPKLTYLDCTCHGFSRITDPKPDFAGTMMVGTGKWSCTVMARFWQNINA